MLLLLWRPGYKLARWSLEAWIPQTPVWFTCVACRDPSFAAHSCSSRLHRAAESQPVYVSPSFSIYYAPSVICLKLKPSNCPSGHSCPHSRKCTELFLSFGFLCKVWQGAWAHPVPTPELRHLLQAGWDQLFYQVLAGSQGCLSLHPSSGVTFLSPLFSFSLPIAWGTLWKFAIAPECPWTLSANLFGQHQQPPGPHRRGLWYVQSYLTAVRLCIATASWDARRPRSGFVS